MPRRKKQQYKAEEKPLFPEVVTDALPKVAELDKLTIESKPLHSVNPVEVNNRHLLAAQLSINTAFDLTVLLAKQVAYVNRRMELHPDAHEVWANVLGKLGTASRAIAASLRESSAMEREVLGMTENNIENAIKLLAAKGYEITDINAQAMAESLESKGYTIIEPAASEQTVDAEASETA